MEDMFTGNHEALEKVQSSPKLLRLFTFFKQSLEENSPRKVEMYLQKIEKTLYGENGIDDDGFPQESFEELISLARAHVSCWTWIQWIVENVQTLELLDERPEEKIPQILQEMSIDSHLTEEQFSIALSILTELVIFEHNHPNQIQQLPQGAVYRIMWNKLKLLTDTRVSTV